MDESTSWQYDEFKQVGKNYAEKSVVAEYDSNHASFRDIEAENTKVIGLLNIQKNDILIDFGSGTGLFAVHAAQQCKKVYAIDVSRAMIDYAMVLAVKTGIVNIEFHHAGFLTYEHKGPLATAIVTTFAFHHLPDFWKGIALKRMNKMLKTGGRLYIHDVILEDNNSVKNISVLIEQLTDQGGELFGQETKQHFKEEFSTYDWVIDGLLSRAGFSIQDKQIQNGVLGTYLCIKN